MKIYQTKWYIVRQTDVSSWRYEIVGNKSFHTMMEAQSYKQRRRQLSSPGRIVASIQGKTILRHPERYSVVDGAVEEGEVMEGMSVGVVVHDLKTWPEYFEATWSGRKPWELRKNDRDYRVGHILRLREWNPATESYTGRAIVANVTYVLPGGAFGLPEDYCIMTLREVTRMADSL